MILNTLRHGWSRALQRFRSCHTDSKALVFYSLNVAAEAATHKDDLW